jgi:hypothetical protein
MVSTKIKVFISYTGADRADLDQLMEWLYPFQEEWNIWYYNRPPRVEPLSLPWRILLFWYRQPDFTASYEAVLEQRFEQAHIYLFLTSHRAVADPKIDRQISRAVERLVEKSDRYIKIYPVLFRPSLWREQSRLGRFKPLGSDKPLLSDHEEEAFMAAVKELREAALAIKRNLEEDQVKLVQAGRVVGEEADSVLYDPSPPKQPAPWLGWVILAVLIMYLLHALKPELPTHGGKHSKQPPPEYKPEEYQREEPLRTPAGN